jgi:hypothetical protein
MAFPRTVFTSGAAAQSALANTLTNQGFTLDADFSIDGGETALVQNLAVDKYQTMSPAAGATGGTGSLVKTSVTSEGGIITTTFLIDLTGMASAAAGDIIGKAAAAPVAYIGQITAALNGTIKGGRMICFEAPAGGEADIDVYAATEATGAYDIAISTLTETQLINSGTQTLGAVSVAIADAVAADQYLYLVSVGAGAAAYTAGRVLIQLYGV